jgi:hypothetical protein
MDGYVFVINDNKQYIDLLNIAVDSILFFSNKNIEIFSVNFNYVAKGERIKVIRIDSADDFESMCFLKFKILMESSFENAIYLDSDIIATSKIDDLFLFEDKITHYPLLPLHCGEPGTDMQGFLNYMNCKNRTQHYVHADIYVSNKKCYDFLKECYDMSIKIKKDNILCFAGDEGLINAVLWKHGVTNEFLPRIDDGWKAFEKKLKIHDWPENIADSLFYVCHGCKDYIRAKDIFGRLKGDNNG